MNCIFKAQSLFSPASPAVCTDTETYRNTGCLCHEGKKCVSFLSPHLISPSWYDTSTYCAPRVPVQTNLIFGNIIFTYRPIKLDSPRSFEGLIPTNKYLIRNFIQIQQQVTNFPIDPHCKEKNCLLSASSRCQKQVIFTMGVHGEILHLLSNPIEILPQEFV